MENRYSTMDSWEDELSCVGNLTFRERIALYRRRMPNLFETFIAANKFNGNSPFAILLLRLNRSLSNRAAQRDGIVTTKCLLLRTMEYKVKRAVN